MISWLDRAVPPFLLSPLFLCLLSSNFCNAFFPLTRVDEDKMSFKPWNQVQKSPEGKSIVYFVILSFKLWFNVLWLKLLRVGCMFSAVSNYFIVHMHMLKNWNRTEV